MFDSIANISNDTPVLGEIINFLDSVLESVEDLVKGIFSSEGALSSLSSEDSSLPSEDSSLPSED